jgi:nucleoside 2-deoxyribosyltransferase
MTTFYLAGPLFSEAERGWNKSFSAELMKSFEKQEPDAKILLPQEFCAPLIADNEPLTFQTATKIHTYCLLHLDLSKVVIAVINGSQVDDGTAFEIGYAYAQKIPIIGIRSDFRPGEWAGCNIMISRSCNRIYTYKETPDYNTLAEILLLAARNEL